MLLPTRRIGGAGALAAKTFYRSFHVYHIVNVRVCEILARYFIEAVSRARGNIISFVVGDVARWAETKLRLTKSIVFKVTSVARVLLATGYLEKLGKKYILRRDSPLWRGAKAGDIEKICEIIESAMSAYSKVVNK
jgi:hypothetical protein